MFLEVFGECGCVGFGLVGWVRLVVCVVGRWGMCRGLLVVVFCSLEFFGELGRLGFGDSVFFVVVGLLFWELCGCGVCGGFLGRVLLFSEFCWDLVG